MDCICPIQTGVAKGVVKLNNPSSKNHGFGPDCPF